MEFSDVEVCVSWQWCNPILSKADAAGKELLLINLDESYVPFYYGNAKGNLAVTNETLPKGCEAFDTGCFS
jgi:hypothetical protein